MLRRRTPLRAQPRAKGNRGELAVRNMCRDHGWPRTKRNWQSGGQGGGDLIDGPADVHLEVKWCERCELRDWLRQAEGEARPTDIPVVALRDNQHAWTAVLPADEWAALAQLSPLDTSADITVASGRIRFWACVELAIERAGLSVSGVPVFEFRWPDTDWYVAVPLELLLELLAVRELA